MKCIRKALILIALLTLCAYSKAEETPPTNPAVVADISKKDVKPTKGDATDTTPRCEYQYFVLVDQLEIHTGPSLSTEVITTVERGTIVQDANNEEAIDKEIEILEKSGVDVRDYGWHGKNHPAILNRSKWGFWRRIRAGIFEGWVPDESVIPTVLFAVYRETDEWARKNEADKMLDALKKVVSSSESYSKNENYIHISPDGQKAIVCDPKYIINREDYPAAIESPDYYTNAILYFIAGKGISKYFVSPTTFEGRWSSDSRYYCAYGENEAECLCLLDSDGKVLIDSKRRYSYVDDPLNAFEFTDGYFIWFGYDDEPVFSSKTILVKVNGVVAKLLVEPGFYALNLDTLEKTQLLAPDWKTAHVSYEEIVYGPLGGGHDVEVVLVPAVSYPSALKETELYQRFNGMKVPTVIRFTHPEDDRR